METVSNLHIGPVQIDGRTESGRDSEKTNITKGHKGQEDVESHDLKRHRRKVKYYKFKNIIKENEHMYFLSVCSHVYMSYIKDLNVK